MTGEGVPIIHFDQLNVIAHHLQAIKDGTESWEDPLQWPEPLTDQTPLMIMKQQTATRLTRKKVMQMKEWPRFRESEHKQLASYTERWYSTPLGMELPIQDRPSYV